MITESNNCVTIYWRKIMSKCKFRSILTLVLVVTLVIPFFTTTVSADYDNTYSNTGNMRDDIIGVALTQVAYTEGSNN